MKDERLKYVEPESYFSKGMRKAAGIGEYAKKEAKGKNKKEAEKTSETKK